MRAIIFKLTFLFSILTITHISGQAVEGDYDNEEIFINGLSIKPGSYITQEELKSAIELDENRIDWGVGLVWNTVKITTYEDDYVGSQVSIYNFNFSKDGGFTIDVAGYENDYGFVPSFHLKSSDIVIGFLGHKFIIETTKKEDVASLFYNGKIEEEYKNGYCGIKVFTHGGKLKFVFNSDDILSSVSLESF